MHKLFNFFQEIQSRTSIMKSISPLATTQLLYMWVINSFLSTYRWLLSPLWLARLKIAIKQPLYF